MVVLKRKMKRQPINDAVLGKERRRIPPNLNLAAVRVLSWRFNDLVSSPQRFPILPAQRVDRVSRRCQHAVVRQCCESRTDSGFGTFGAADKQSLIHRAAKEGLRFYPDCSSVPAETQTTFPAADRHFGKARSLQLVKSAGHRHGRVSEARDQFSRNKHLPCIAEQCVEDDNLS